MPEAPFTSAALVLTLAGSLVLASCSSDVAGPRPGWEDLKSCPAQVPLEPSALSSFTNEACNMSDLEILLPDGQAVQIEQVGTVQVGDLRNGDGTYFIVNQGLDGTSLMISTPSETVFYGSPDAIASAMTIALKSDYVTN